MGPCTDNLDNDGNGLTDEKDPKCSSLQGFSTFAASGTSLRGVSVRAGVGVRVSESALDAGASICGRLTDMRSLATIEGTVVAVNHGRFSHRQSSGIGGKYVTTEGLTPPIPWAAALVGPDMGTCSTSANACLSPLDCAGRREECIGRPKLNAVNPSVDLTGTGAGANELGRCSAALEQMTNDMSLLALTAPSLGSLRVGRDNRQVRLDIGPGGTILNYDSFILGVRGVLTINAPRRAALIFRVSGRAAFLAHSRIELTGGIEPENILWLITGNKGVILVDHNALFQGFMYAPNRIVYIDSKTAVRGSLVGRQVKLGRLSTLEHHPFLSLLPSSVTMTVPAITSPGAITYTANVTNNGPGWAVVANFTFDLDPATTFVSAVPSQGLCMHDGSEVGGTVTCYLGDLADPASTPANQATVQIDVSTSGGTASNATATLSHTIAPSGDLVVPVSTP